MTHAASLIQTPPAHGSWNALLQPLVAPAARPAPPPPPRDERPTARPPALGPAAPRPSRPAPVEDRTAYEARPLGMRRLREALVAEGRAFEVGLAPRSASNLVAGFEGVDGVFVQTWAEVERDALYALTLHLPGGATVEALGRVALVRGACADAAPGLVLRFERLTDDEACALAAFAARREPLFVA